MSFTYEWEITGIKCKDQPNQEGGVHVGSVCQTYWKLTGTDEGGDVGTFSGATPFCAENCTTENYCEFEFLTEEIVLSWIQDVVDKDLSYKNHIDQQIQRMIDNTKVTEPSMPWAPVEDDETVDPE